jgi:hypothetical protein
MSPATRELERSIRLLPFDDMVALHECLIAAIHETEDSKELDPAFRSDIARRVQSVDSGHAVGIDAFRALEKM